MSVTKYFPAIKNINKENILDLNLNTNLKIIIPDNNTFIADPFIFKYNDEYYAFFELWDYNKGVIAYTKLDDNYNFTKIEICLNLNYHLSFPCIFTYKNNIYMIPETGSQHRIELYECQTFPMKWKKTKNLITNIYAPDVIFFEYDNNVYLITNDNEYLKLFYSDDLFNNFKEHPYNKIKKKTNSRNAGHIFKFNNILYRPAQICTPSYGYAIAIYKIIKLNIYEYEEELVKIYNPNWFPELTGFHTFNVYDNLLIIDGRLRIKSPYMKKVNSINGIVYKSTDDDTYVNNYIKKLYQ